MFDVCRRTNLLARDKVQQLPGVGCCGAGGVTHITPFSLREFEELLKDSLPKILKLSVVMIELKSMIVK